MNEVTLGRRSALGLAAAATATALMGSSASAAPAPQPPRGGWCPSRIRGFMTNGKLVGNDFVTMRDTWGVNAVRLQILLRRYVEELGLPFWDAWPIILGQVEDEVRRAHEAGLKIIVDLHQAPLPGVASSQPEFWSHPDVVSSFQRLWGDLATRLQPFRSSLWGYDLYNEPLDRSQLPNMPRQWPEIAEQIIATIRTVDTQTPIIFETGPGFFFTGFRNLTQPLSDDKVIYSAHFYAPDHFTHQGIVTSDINRPYPGTHGGENWDRNRLMQEMQPATDFQARWKVPIYVGEFSVIRWAPKEDAVRWLDDALGLFEERGWSWTYHAFREYSGWSLEHDETYTPPGSPAPPPVDYVTGRGKVMLRYLRLNNAASHAAVNR